MTELGPSSKRRLGWKLHPGWEQEVDSVEVLEAAVELTACFLGLPSVEERCNLTANMEKPSQFSSLNFKDSHYI